MLWCVHRLFFMKVAKTKSNNCWLSSSWRKSNECDSFSDVADNDSSHDTDAAINDADDAYDECTIDEYADASDE